MTLGELLIGVFWHYFEEFLDIVIPNVSTGALIAIPAITIALLIPLATFLNDEKEKQFPFDKKIIFNSILHFRPLIALVLLVSFTLCFSDIDSFKVISAGIDLLIIILVSVVVIQFYKWFCVFDNSTDKMSYRQSKRIQYLNRLNDPDEIYETWQLIFNKDLGKLNQVGLVKAYINAAHKTEPTNHDMLRELNYRAFIQLGISHLEAIRFCDARDFEEFENYTISFIKDQQEASAETIQSDKSTALLVIVQNKKNLFYALMELAFSDLRNYRWYMFLDFLAEQNLDCDQKEVFQFWHEFYRRLFRLLETSTYDLDNLQYTKLLRQSRITTNAIQNRKLSSIQKAILYAHINYIQEKFDSNQELSPRAAQNIDRTIELIFENIDVIMWIDILSFIVSSYGFGDEGAEIGKVLNWCQQKKSRNFGKRSSSENITMSQSPDHEGYFTINMHIQDSSRRSVTARLFLVAFPNVITLERLSYYKDLLERLLRDDDYSDEDQWHISLLLNEIKELLINAREMKN